MYIHQWQWQWPRAKEEESSNKHSQPMRYGSQLGGQWRGIILRRPGQWNNMCPIMQLRLYGVRNVQL